MALVDRLINIEHCFTADPETLDTQSLPPLRYPDRFVLEDHRLSKSDFETMPDFAPEDVTSEHSGTWNIFTNVACPRYKDDTGDHMFWFFRVNTTAIDGLASLSDEQIDPFARRWITHALYAPFQFPPEISYEVVKQRLTEDNFQRIRKFLPLFCGMCRQALASGKGIYVLWERHEYRTEELAAAHKRKSVGQVSGDGELLHSSCTGL
jgi:hypothetical protein